MNKDTCDKSLSGKHCWHDTGLMLPCIPAKYEQLCCWCGKRRLLVEDEIPDINYHGEYHPDKPKSKS